MGEELTSLGQKWLQKAGISGEAFRFPEPGQLKQPFQTVMRAWKTTLCGNMKTEQIKVMKAFKFMWRRDDEDLASRPNRGVALTLKDLQFFMRAGRVSRSDFLDTQGQSEISVNDWAKVEDAKDELVYKTTYSVTPDPAANPPVVGVVETPRTDEASLVVVDKIVNFLTNDYYRSETDGEAGKAYFANASKNLDALEVAYSNLAMYLPYSLQPSFTNGAYQSWDSTISAMRRLHGVDECQETMMDIMKDLIRIARKSQRMEQKVAEFREFARKLMITEKSEFIRCRDFPDDVTAYMTMAESYGPLMNTMFNTLVVALTVPSSRFDPIQTMFAARTVDTSYRAWHMNRPEFYKIIDAEKKLPGSVGSVDNNDDECVGYAGQQSRRSGNRGDRQKSRKSKKTVQKSTRKGRDGKNRSTGGKGGNKSADRMCRHDTQHAGRPIYHDAPYGGGRNCKYDRNGKPRKSRALGEVSGSADVGECDDSPADDDKDGNGDASDSSSDGCYGVDEDDYCPSFSGDCVGNDI